jgi:uncharacterized membrane protein (DUF485 family)
VTDQALYVRALRLRHLQLPTWLRFTLAEGSVVLGLLLALAEVASAWVIVVLPLAVAAMVKFHDVLQGALLRSDHPRP